MPGFSIEGKNSGIAKNNLAEYRRKHRWRITSISDSSLSPADWLQLKSATRPSFSMNETEVHHDQEVAYFAGKQTWDPVVLTFYDSVGGGAKDMSKLLYDWVKKTADIPQGNVGVPGTYKTSLKLSSTDASGAPDETWTLHGCWPAKSNWSDLDYSNTEIQVVEITVRFDRAIRT